MKSARFYNSREGAPKPNKPIHMGVTAIIEKGGKVLLEHRKDSERWAFIGGGLKIDESIPECLAREVFEETGLKISRYGLFDVFSNPYRIAEYPDGNVLRIISAAYFVETEDKPPVCSEESRELGWFSGGDLENVMLAETQQDIRESYIQYKKQQER